jgi:hypothetical protein
MDPRTSSQHPIPFAYATLLWGSVDSPYFETFIPATSLITIPSINHSIVDQSEHCHIRLKFKTKSLAARTDLPVGQPKSKHCAPLFLTTLSPCSLPCWRIRTFTILLILLQTMHFTHLSLFCSLDLARSPSSIASPRLCAFPHEVAADGQSWPLPHHPMRLDLRASWCIIDASIFCKKSNELNTCNPSDGALYCMVQSWKHA